MTALNLNRGTRFLHRHWLESGDNLSPGASPKAPLQCVVTRIAKDTIYWRPVAGGGVMSFARAEADRFVAAVVTDADAPGPNTTRDGIEVRVGQRWRDCDQRMAGRVCEVVAVVAGRAHLQRWSRYGGATGTTTKVAIRRMHKHSTGWELVCDAKPST